MGEYAHGNDSRPLVDHGLERQRVGNRQSVYVDQHLAVVGDQRNTIAQTNLRRTTQRAELPHHAETGHRYDFNRQGESAQPLDQLGGVRDTHKTIRLCGHDLLARQRRPAAFDQKTARIDLIGTIDVDTQALHRVAVDNLDAMGLQQARTGLRAGHGGTHLVLDPSQSQDELVHRGARANTYDLARGDVGQGSLGHHGLEFVLCGHKGCARLTGRFGRIRPITRNYPMPFVPYRLARPFLFGLDAETAHELALHALALTQRTPLTLAYANGLVKDPVRVAGLEFPNRVGLAAGLDKNARCIDALGAMGFGFVEVGTVTPLPQAGNPKPRMFRLPDAQALINRLGFNNDGLDAFVANVERSRFRASGRILGLNIGKNAATPITQAADDYVKCLRGVFVHADYVTVNISSPNTSQLRELQQDAALDSLLQTLGREQLVLQDRHSRKVPLFVKIAPDLQPDQITQIARLLVRHKMDGVVATNTTLNRDAVLGMRHAQQAGGLSGAPVRDQSNRVIALLRKELGNGFPIIGVGGILSAADAVEKINAGADLVQIYTGLIYHGPDLVTRAATAIRTQQRAKNC